MKKGNQKGRSEKAAIRRLESLRLRQQGMSYPAIGKQLSISTTQAFRDVKSALAYRIKIDVDKIEIERQLQEDRLDLALNAIWGRIKSGNLSATSELVRIEKRRAELLGLDKPIKIAPTNPEGDKEYSGMTEDELRRRLIALLGEDGIRKIIGSHVGDIEDG